MTRFRVGFQDTDSTGRVYFPSYVRWFDIAFIEHLRSRGIVFDPQGRLKIGDKLLNSTLVIGEYHCRIEKPSGYDDEVEAEIASTESGNKSLKVFFNLRDPWGNLLAHGYITYVMVDLGTGRAVPLDEKLLKTILDNSRAKT